MSEVVIRAGQARILIGDVMARLGDIPDESIDCVVTSPPYWGLRDYGVPGQLGLEPTLGEHIDAIVAVCAEIHRVLKPTGTFWLNYGDCYATAPNGRSAAQTKAEGGDDRSFRDKPFSTVGPIRAQKENLGNQGGDGRGGIRKDGPIYDAGWATSRGQFRSDPKGQRRIDHGGRVVAGGYLKPKDLVMAPNRIAIALQEWGWWVRSEIIWGKTNPMPDSSGSARPSTAHEKIFMLTKSGEGDVWRARDTGEISFQPNLDEMVPCVTKPEKLARRWLKIGAYYDAGAVRQAISENTHARVAQNVDAQAGSARGYGGKKGNGRMKAVVSKVAPRASGHRANTHYNEALETFDRAEALARRPLPLPAGWDTTTGDGSHGKIHRTGRKRGVTPRHEGHIGNEFLDSVSRGQGRFLRNYEPAEPIVWPMATAPFKEAHFATFPPELAARCILAGCPRGGVVLDPFGGAGSTALAALRLDRQAILIELNPAYVDIAANRLREDFMGSEEKRLHRGKQNPSKPGPLFEEETA